MNNSTIQKEKRTSLSLVVRERRSTNEELELPAEHSVVLFVVVAVAVADARGNASDAGRLLGGLKAPVSLLGLMSSDGAVSKEHGGGTARRGRPRGELDDTTAEFFIFSLGLACASGRGRSRGPVKKSL